MQNKEAKELIKKNRTTKEITGDKLMKIGGKSTASGSNASIAMDPDTMHENAHTLKGKVKERATKAKAKERAKHIGVEKDNMAQQEKET